MAEEDEHALVSDLLAADHTTTIKAMAGRDHTASQPLLDACVKPTVVKIKMAPATKVKTAAVESHSGLRSTNSVKSPV